MVFIFGRSVNIWVEHDKDMLFNKDRKPEPICMYIKHRVVDIQIKIRTLLILLQAVEFIA